MVDVRNSAIVLYKLVVAESPDTEELCLEGRYRGLGNLAGEIAESVEHIVRTSDCDVGVFVERHNPFVFCRNGGCGKLENSSAGNTPGAYIADAVDGSPPTCREMTVIGRHSPVGGISSSRCLLL